MGEWNLLLRLRLPRRPLTRFKNSQAFFHNLAIVDDMSVSRDQAGVEKNTTLCADKNHWCKVEINNLINVACVVECGKNDDVSTSHKVISDVHKNRF